MSLGVAGREVRRRPRRALPALLVPMMAPVRSITTPPLMPPRAPEKFGMRDISAHTSTLSLPSDRLCLADLLLTQVPAVDSAGFAARKADVKGFPRFVAAFCEDERFPPVICVRRSDHGHISGPMKCHFGVRRFAGRPFFRPPWTITSWHPSTTWRAVSQTPLGAIARADPTVVLGFPLRSRMRLVCGRGA